MKKLLMKKGPDLPRIVALVLVAVLSCIGTKAFAQDSEIEIDGVTYTIADGKATVSVAEDATNITIKATVGDNIPVTAVEEGGAMEVI